MKNYGTAFFLAMVLIVPCSGSAQDHYFQEKDLARQRIVVLRDQLKAEKDVENRKKLLQEIAKQRKIIADQTSWAEKWGWSVAKAAGAVALVSLAAYKFFATPPAQIQQKILSTKNSSQSVGAQEKDASLFQGSLWANKMPSIWPEKNLQPLTKEEIEKYKKVRNVYAGLTAWLGFTEVSSWLLFPTVAANPILLSLVGISAVSSVVYHVRAWPEGHPVPTILGDIFPH